VLLVDAWADALGRRPRGIDESFLSLGATPRALALMRERVREACGIEKVLDWVTGEETVDELAAALIERHHPEACRTFFARRADAPTLFFLHGDVNGRGFYVPRLARLLEDDVALCALAPHGPDDGPVRDGIEGMAADFLATIRRIQPAGPYWIGGYCNGSLVAYELARQIDAQGERVARVVLIDPSLRNFRVWFLRRPVAALGRWLRMDPLRRQRIVRRFRDAGFAAEVAMRGAAEGLGRLRRASWRERFAYLARRTRGGAGHESRPSPRPTLSAVARARSAERHRRFEAYVLACRGYIPGRFPGRIDTIWADARIRERGYEARAGWPWVAARVELTVVPGTHQSCVATHLETTAAVMRAALRDG
jgi:thioesterase domain-containing protein